jgi:hypothetical protein
MKCKIPQFLGLIGTLAIVFPVFAPLAWSDSPKVSNPVCTFYSAQSNPVAVGHPSGGAIIAWQDKRNGNSDIYAQRLCGCDSMDWSSNGTPVCTANGDQQHPVIISDSSGGAIIAWEDKRNGNYNIFVQKVNAWGVALWAANGVALCGSPFDQRNPSITGDSAGGAIVTWEDKRHGGDFPDIYAQRITQDGAVKWDSNGVAVCVQAGDQLDPRVIDNVMGGAIIAWEDKRSEDYDIYAQRIDASGAPLWAANGVVISSAISDQLRPRMIGDGSYGAIIVWYDFRNTIDYNIFAQRIGADGTVKWAVYGLAINNKMSSDQINPVIAADGGGGAIIAWEDKRAGDVDIYGQRVDSSGIVQWTSTGVLICSATGDQVNPQIVSVYSGGANIAWMDSRNAASDIYIQQITAEGRKISATGGSAVCTADSSQINPVLCNNGSDGAIVIWQDFRNKNSNIYAQIIPRESLVTGLKPVSSAETPSCKWTIRIDQSGKIHYEVENAGRVSLEILGLSGRLRATLVNGHRNPGSYSVAVSDNHARGRIPCGVYLCRFTKDNFKSVHTVSLMR